VGVGEARIRVGRVAQDKGWWMGTIDRGRIMKIVGEG
jgi:hypothetical protein